MADTSSRLRWVDNHIEASKIVSGNGTVSCVNKDRYIISLAKVWRFSIGNLFLVHTNEWREYAVLVTNKVMQTPFFLARL